MNRAYANDPELMEAFELYRMCVNKQMHTFEKEGARVTKFYPTGLSFLPHPGSLMDQPQRLMEYFQCFMIGEKAEFFRG